MEWNVERRAHQWRWAFSQKHKYILLWYLFHFQPNRNLERNTTTIKLWVDTLLANLCICEYTYIFFVFWNIAKKFMFTYILIMQSEQLSIGFFFAFSDFEWMFSWRIWTGHLTFNALTEFLANTKMLYKDIGLMTHNTSDNTLRKNMWNKFAAQKKQNMDGTDFWLCLSLTMKFPW